MTNIEQLRIRDIIPNDEICHCDKATKLHLRYAFAEFPFYCSECNGQIFPEALNLDENLAEVVVSWRTVYSSLYHLWLDSGAYEEFAKHALCDPRGEVNIKGMKISKMVSAIRPTLYNFFHDCDDAPPEDCPVCGTRLQANDVCYDCNLTI
jgi:hypothetical protein